MCSLTFTIPTRNIEVINLQHFWSDQFAPSQFWLLMQCLHRPHLAVQTYFHLLHDRCDEYTDGFFPWRVKSLSLRLMWRVSYAAIQRRPQKSPQNSKFFLWIHPEESCRQKLSQLTFTKSRYKRVANNNIVLILNVCQYTPRIRFASPHVPVHSNENPMMPFPPITWHS